MDPNNFPNRNSADNGMPTFGGGDGPHWPDHEDYRVQTPGSVGSAIDSKFDPFFDTTSYHVEEMDSCCGQPPAPTPTPARKKRAKVNARKDKGPTVPLSISEVNNEYAEGHMDYEDKEFKTLTQCWIVITDDPIISNNQPGAWYWDRIVAKYNEVNPTWAYKRNKEQLCKCWNRMRKHINTFKGIYKRTNDARASGESMENVLERALMTYQGQHMQFKLYNVWTMLKDKSKFDEGIEIPGLEMTENTAIGGYTSTNGRSRVPPHQHILVVPMATRPP